jgi:hypothetical protein
LLEEESMKVFGLKEMVIERAQSLGDGLFRAGISHMVAFVMEPLTHQNWKFWYDYAGYMKICAKGSVHQTQTDIAIKGFTNALDLIDSPTAAVFVVYSTLDVSTTEADNVMKMINIQMCMTVTTSASIPNFPVVTHMGIFRSPLLSQDLGKLDKALSEIKSVLSKQPEFYKDKPAKAISLVLHSFAARAIMTISNGHQAKLMITAPVEHMGGLLSEVGKIFVEKIVPKSPKSNLNAPLLTMSRPSLSSPGIVPRRSVVSSSKDPTAKIGATPSSKIGVTSISKIGVTPLPKIGVTPLPKIEVTPTPEIEVTSTPKIEVNPTPKIEETPKQLEIMPIQEGGNSGYLKYCLNQSPMFSLLKIWYDKEEYEWTNRECAWLFALAFNPSHKYAATFTNLRVLRELHQDITISSGPHQAKAVNLK